MFGKVNFILKTCDIVNKKNYIILVDGQWSQAFFERRLQVSSNLSNILVIGIAIETFGFN